jgi:hypothetical protein
MRTFMMKLRELAFRMKLYLYGVRFFERDTVNGETVAFEAKYSILNQYSVTITFQRVECIDFIMKRGYIVGENYVSYAACATFEGDTPPRMVPLHGKWFFFNGFTNGFSHGEEMTLALISDLYLDFIRAVDQNRITAPSSL